VLSSPAQGRMQARAAIARSRRKSIFRNSANVRRNRAAGVVVVSKSPLPAAPVHGRGSSPALFIRMQSTVAGRRLVNRTANDVDCRIVVRQSESSFPIDRAQFAPCDLKRRFTRRQAMGDSEAENQPATPMMASGRPQVASRSSKRRKPRRTRRARRDARDSVRWVSDRAPSASDRATNDQGNPAAAETVDFKTRVIRRSGSPHGSVRWFDCQAIVSATLGFLPMACRRPSCLR